VSRRRTGRRRTAWGCRSARSSRKTRTPVEARKHHPHVNAQKTALRRHVSEKAHRLVHHAHRPVPDALVEDGAREARGDEQAVLALCGAMHHICHGFGREKGSRGPPDASSGPVKDRLLVGCRSLTLPASRPPARQSHDLTQHTSPVMMTSTGRHQHLGHIPAAGVHAGETGEAGVVHGADGEGSAVAAHERGA
jgi:hypothetical protein